MNKESFEKKMKKLEQEREEYIRKLSPERQQEFKQKNEELNKIYGNNGGFSSPNGSLNNF